MLKRLLKLLKLKKTWAIGIAIIIVGGIVFAATRPAPSATFTLASVSKGTLIQTVDATGDIASVDEVDLSFDTSGPVGAVFFEVGDQVRAGQVIALLRDREASADVEGAYQALQAAEGNLAVRIAGATDEEIAMASAQRDAARAARDAAQISVANAQIVQTHALEVQTATVADAEANLVDVKENLITAMRGAMIASRSALSEADETLGVDNMLANDDFQSVLAATDAQSLTDAVNAYETAILRLAEAETIVFGLSSSATLEEVLGAYTRIKTSLSDTSLTLLYTRRVLDATAIDTADFTFADLSAAKAALDAERDSVQATGSSLTTAHQAILSAQNARILAIARQSSEVATAEANVKTAEATLASREADLASAEASLQNTTAGPRPVDLLALRAAVDQARAVVSSAEARQAKTQLVAPIDGTLTRLDVEVGELASAAASVATVQTVGDQFEVIVDIPESDITKLAIDNTVTMTFDAFGSDVKTSARVARIDPAQKTVEGVVYYEVTVYLNPEADALDLKPGMTANLTILTSTKAEALYVPQRAVLEHADGTKYVRIPEGETFREQLVTTGLRGDEGRLELTSGVSEGDDIVLSVQEPK